MKRRFLLRAVVAATVLLCAAVLTIGCSGNDKSNNPVAPTQTWAWHTLGNGIVGVVEALQEYNGRLYAAGDFTQAGAVTVRNIAVWDDTAWAPVDVGTSYAVFAMTVYDGKLIVGGGFSYAGGIAVNHVAAWDGTSFTALGSGLTGSNAVVYGLTVIHDSLFAVGSYGAAMLATPLVAAWDGSKWATIPAAVGSGLDWAVCSTDSGDIMVGGYYIDSVSMYSCVQRRNAGVWYDLDDSTLPPSIQDLVYWNGYAVACGAGDTPVRYFSTQWQQMGTQTFTDPAHTPSVRRLCVFNGNLVACGSFETIGSTTVNGVASFNGTTWSALGGGITDGTEGYTLAVRDSNLYMGGNFVTLGGDTVNNIAVWSPK